MLLTVSLAFGLFPGSLFSGWIPQAHAANEARLPEEYSYRIPEASDPELSPVIPPTIIDETTAIIPSVAKSEPEPLPEAPELKIPEAAEDDSRFILLLSSCGGFSNLSGADAEFFCTYTGIAPETFSCFEKQGVSLQLSVDYGTLVSVLGCAPSEVLEIRPASSQLQTILKEASVYQQLLREDLKGTNLDRELRSCILQGYTCDQVFDAYALSQLFGGKTDEYLDSDVKTVLASRQAAGSQKGSGDDDRNDEDAPDLYEQFRSIRSQLMESYQPVRDSTEEIDIQTAYLGAPFVYDSNENESVALNSGSLTYETIDYVLPGINDLDLEIGRHYSSQEAGIRRPDGYVSECYYNGYEVVYGCLAYYYVPGFGRGRWPIYDEEYISGFFSTYAAAQAFAAQCPSGQVVYPNYAYGADLILEYYANIENAEQAGYSYNNSTAANDHFTNMFGLGHGWSFNFSSIEKIGDTYYLHLSNGTVYQIEFSQEGSGLVDYPLSDMVFSWYSVYFSNGVESASYKLTYQDGRVEYFNFDGKLIGIRDRFQNTITFVHSTQNGYPCITITDTLGRVTVISGQSTSDGHTMTIQLPTNVTLSYAVVHDNDARALSSYTDPVGSTTYYSYTKQTAGFNAFNANITAASVDYLNLTTITHPTFAQSVYSYGTTIRNLMEHGQIQAYRVTSRKDLVGTDEYNHLTYSYSQDDYTGFPDYSIYGRPYNFTYYTTITDGSGVEVRSTFNKQHDLARKDVQKNSVLISAEEYTYINKLPTQIISYSYSPGNQTSPMTAIVCRQYDQKARVTAAWSVLADGDRTDVEHKTIYTYDNSYGLPLSTTYKTGPYTTVELRNTLDASGKMVTRTEVYENNTLKQRTDLTCDAYGNVTGEKRYYHTNASFDTYDLTEYTYSNNAYLASVTNSGIKTADGTNAQATPGKTAGTIAQYYTYDTLGRLTSSSDGSGNVTSFAYDALGNVTQITNPDSTTVTYARNYSQNTVTVTDENGRQTGYHYTPLGLESEVVDVLTNNVITQKTYDAMSRLTEVSDYVYGSTTEYAYDYLGRVVSETVKQGGTVLSQRLTAYDDAAENGMYRKETLTVAGDADAPSEVSTQYTDKAGNVVKTGRFLNNTEYFDTATYDYVGNLLTRLTAADAAKNLPFSVKYEYDANGRVTKEYNAQNQYITRTYDPRGRLVSVTDYAGTPTVYTYDDLDRLLSETVTIQAGVTATSKYEYDAAGNIIRKWTPVNAVGSTAAWSKCEYSYDSRRNLTAVRQYNGNTLASQTSYTYDGRGNVLSMTAGGHTTEYTYDRYGNVLTMEDALGQTESCSYSALGKLLTKTDRNGITTSYTYDALGRVLAVTAGSGNNAETVQYAYTKTGRIALETNRWQQTSYAYDELGRTILVEETELESVHPGFVVTLDAAGGTVYPGTLHLSTGDTYVLPTPVRPGYTFQGWYLGNTRIFNGDTVQVTEACTLTAHWSINTYSISLNANGGQVSPIALLVTWDDVYALPTPTYNNHIFGGWYLGDTRINDGDPVRITENSTFVARWATHTYTVTLDANGGQVSPGQITAVEYGIYDLPTPTRAGYVFTGWYLGNTLISNGDPVQITQNSTFVAHWVQSAYTITLDANGGQVSPSTVEVGPDGSYTLPTPTKTGYTFDGWYLNSTLIPQDGSVPLNSSCTLTAHWTVLSYSVFFYRNFTSSDMRGAIVRFNFDTEYTLTSRFTRSGYVLVGWCTARDVSNGTFYPVNSVVQNLTNIPNSVFNLYAIWEPNTRSGTPNPKSGGPSTPMYTKTYTYDLAGNRTGFTLTQGSETIQDVTYTYDTLNRLSAVSEGNVTQASYTYDTNGNRTSLTYTNGVTETYSYNLANWVTGLANMDGSTTLSAFTYTYYASGNRKTETDQSGKTTSYTYDGLGRLTQESETNGKTIAYSYDAAGNRTQMSVTGTETYTVAYSYNANNRLQTETKTQTGGNTVTYYTYDANGNTLSRMVLAGGNTTEATAYGYDRFNRLISLTGGGGTVYYSYNANGIRTAKLAGGILTSFLLDGGAVVAELQNDVLQTSYLRGINLICREQGTATQYYLFDAHADVVALTDEDGDVTKNYDYDAFGCEASPDLLDTNPFRYCGEYFDVESGSYYLRARYYVPTIGRFTQQDTHWSTANMIYGDNPQKINERQNALGLNTYTIVPQLSAIMQAGNQYVYALSNPLAFTDQTGEIAITTLILIGSAVIALIAAGTTAYNSYHYTGQIDWANTITTGLSWFMMAYTLGMSAYGIYLSYCDYKGLAPVAEVNFNPDASVEMPNGAWKAVNESMSDASRAYQTQITGHTNEAYIVNKVKFDGVSTSGHLIEAKGDYSHFISQKTGSFYDWFAGADDLVNQARRQISAAGGIPIDWYFSDYSTMKAVQSLFRSKGISGISYIYQAAK